jgi:hypothetical protein
VQFLELEAAPRDGRQGEVIEQVAPGKVERAQLAAPQGNRPESYVRQLMAPAEYEMLNVRAVSRDSPQRHIRNLVTVGEVEADEVRLNDAELLYCCIRHYISRIHRVLVEIDVGLDRVVFGLVTEVPQEPVQPLSALHGLGGDLIVRLLLHIWGLPFLRRNWVRFPHIIHIVS